MTRARVTIDAIQTSDLIYYDPDFNDSCYRFCQNRDIDCLPSLDNPMKFFRKTGKGFIEEEVTPERLVDSQEFIFDESLMESFRANHLLFVYTNKELTGVVHFSDYNRPEVDDYLFGLLSAYERSLRKLLIQNGLKNQDMLAYFQAVVDSSKEADEKQKYRRKIKEDEKYRTRNEKLPNFEKFYLRDLIELAEDRGIIKVGENVNDLRNMVMHAHELVNLEDVSRNDYIYDFETFEKFFKRVLDLLRDFKKVNNKIALSGMSGG